MPQKCWTGHLQSSILYCPPSCQQPRCLRQPSDTRGACLPAPAPAPVELPQHVTLSWCHVWQGSGTLWLAMGWQLMATRAVVGRLHNSRVARGHLGHLWRSKSSAGQKGKPTAWFAEIALFIMSNLMTSQDFIRDMFCDQRGPRALEQWADSLAFFASLLSPALARMFCYSALTLLERQSVDLTLTKPTSQP